MLKGKIVNLRMLTLHDIPIVSKWWQDTELVHYYDRLPVNTSDEIKQELKMNMHSRKYSYFIIEDKKKNPIGCTYLKNINMKDRNTELHVLIGEKDKINKVYGIESSFLLSLYAFRQLNMHKIYGRVIEFSTTAVAMSEQNGSVKEAVYKKYVYHKGRYWDLFIYGLLKEEFEKYLKTSRGRGTLAVYESLGN